MSGEDMGGTPTDGKESSSDRFSEMQQRLENIDKSLAAAKGSFGTLPGCGTLSGLNLRYTESERVGDDVMETEDGSSELTHTQSNMRLQEEVKSLKSQLAETRDQADELAAEPGDRAIKRFQQLEREQDRIRTQYLAERSRREAIEGELNNLHSSYCDLRTKTESVGERYREEVQALQEELSSLQTRQTSISPSLSPSPVVPRALVQTYASSPPKRRHASPEREHSRGHAAKQSPHVYLPSRIATGKRPLVVCRLWKEAARTRERGPYTLLARTAEAANEEVSLTVELDAGHSVAAHTFDNVLEVGSSAHALADSLTPVLSAALSGLPSALLMYSSHSTVTSDPKGSTLLALGSRFWGLMTEASERDGFRWGVYLTSVEVRSDIVRDLLNTDRQYTRLQVEGRAGHIKHTVVATPAGPEVLDCAHPAVDSATSLKKLLQVAHGSRSITADGETRGHVFHILTCHRRSTTGIPVRGSVVIADLACDADFPAELPPGKTADNPSSVQAAQEARERERQSVRKSLGIVSDIFTSLAYPQRMSISPKRERDAFPVGSRVEVVGLKAVDFLHMNGERGGVVGKGDGEIAGRVMVKLDGAGRSLPFLPQNLIPLDDLGRQKSSSPQAVPVVQQRRVAQSPIRSGSSPRRSTPSPLQFYTPPQRRSGSRSNSKSTRFSLPRGSRHTVAEASPLQPTLPRPAVRILLQAALERGMLGTVANFPVVGPEPSGMALLDLCTRIHNYPLGAGPIA